MASEVRRSGEHVLEHRRAVQSLHDQVARTRIRDRRRGITLIARVRHDLRLAREGPTVSSPAQHLTRPVLEDLRVPAFGELRSRRLHCLSLPPS